MQDFQIREFFSFHNFFDVQEIKKIEIGFSNRVYLINGDYILKICGSEENESRFKEEVYFYNFFEGKIPVPKILLLDSSKKLLPQSCIVYKKIPGETLYSQWHLLSREMRKGMIHQLCEILKVINSSSYEVFAREFQVDTGVNWHQLKVESIRKLTREMREKGILFADIITSIDAFVEQHHEVMRDQKIGLTYWDPHFDNVIVSDSKVVGLLDFEGVGIMSIDYVLDAVWRLTHFPKIYASEGMMKDVKEEDYAEIFEWFREFYPELFDFSDINRRIDLYSIEYDLELLLKFPEAEEVKGRLIKVSLLP